MALKDGDVIGLGDSSLLRVAISAAAPPGAAAGAGAAAARAPLAVPTVESFLTAECEAAVQRLQARR